LLAADTCGTNEINDGSMKNITDKVRAFDSSGVGNTTNNIFGLPFTPEESSLVFIPVPWDVTVSSREGASAGPRAILEASYQIDLYEPFAPGAWKGGMAMEPADPDIARTSKNLREKASRYIHFLESGGKAGEDPQMDGIAAEINRAGDALSEKLEGKCLSYLGNQQIPFLVGGDHSVPLGLIRALGKRNPGFGILQIDAHADLRHRYQGFTHSHASIMRNALQVNGLGPLVQVGLRDVCDEEVQVIRENPGKVTAFFDRDIQEKLFRGSSWDDICAEIAARLPDQVYVSFDVDGLDPALCPGTGTPVPGGLSYNQAMYLLEYLVEKGKRIVAADLSETGPGPLDGIVSCRILYRLASMMVRSANE
jgi:agmatinase